jgi:molybdenum cofactor cytidylyltransferase
MIWAFVLAAGESLRMGTQKLLLPFGETTVIETIVRTALDSSVDETMVVLGADREKVRNVLQSYPLTFAVNENYRSGMLSSVQAGFEALPGGAEAAVVMLGDQPGIAPEVVDGLVRGYRESGRGIVVPVHGGRRGHPVLIEAGYRSEILGLDPAIGLKQLVRAHAEDVLEVPAESASVLKDMDRPWDYVAQTGRMPGKKR